MLQTEFEPVAIKIGCLSQWWVWGPYPLSGLHGRCCGVETGQLRTR